MGMVRELRAEESTLLTLLRAALHGGDLPENASVAFPFACEHAVTALLYDALAPVELDAQGRELLHRETTVCVRRFYRLLFLTRYYVLTLREAGVETVVLKGAGAAVWYPVPEYREFGDVDLLLLDPADEERAAAALERIGAKRNAEQNVERHVSFTGTDGIRVELHRSVVADFGDRHVNGIVAQAQSCLRGHVTEKELLPGVSLPVAEDGLQAFFLLLHMLQHHLRKGFGLRLLCDWAVFWNRAVEQEQLELYLDLTRRSGTAGFSRLVTQTCETYLGLEQRFAAPLTAGGERVSDGLRAEFLRDVLDAREFGRDSDERIVALRGRKPADYLREFHRQMLHNYPRAGRSILLWPLLWLFTLMRFLYNNHAVRHASLRTILREASRRSAVMEQLRLFQPEKRTGPEKN